MSSAKSKDGESMGKPSDFNQALLHSSCTGLLVDGGIYVGKTKKHTKPDWVMCPKFEFSVGASKGTIEAPKAERISCELICRCLSCLDLIVDNDYVYVWFGRENRIIVLAGSQTH